MDATQWVLAVLLGLGLAASTGLKTFLPLLMLAVAGRFHLAGVTLNQNLAWVGSDVALAVLTLATVVEIAGDKVPVIDHGLDALGTFIRPVAGWLAAASVLGHADPTTAAVVGLILGTPTALGIHAAKSATRVTSTATTMGVANPFLSLVEDVTAFLLALVSFLVPVLVPVALGLLIWLFVRLARTVRRRLAPLNAAVAGSKGGSAGGEG
jgi:hypothetical protein